MADHNDEGGGSGGDLPPSDATRLEIRALAERWPMSPKVRIRLLQKMVNIVAKSPKERNRIAAFRALIASDSLNLEQRRLDLAEGLTDDVSGPGVIVLHGDPETRPSPPADGAEA